MTDIERRPSPPPMPSFQDVEPARVADELEQRLTIARQRIESAVAGDPDELIITLELISEDLARRFAPLRHLNSVAANPDVRGAYERSLAAITDYRTWLGQHQGLYQAFRQFADAADFADRPDAERALVEHALTDFQLSGAQLPPEGRERVRQLIADLSALGQRFESQLLDATDAWQLPLTDAEMLAGVPEGARTLLAERAREKDLSGWLITLDPAIVSTILTHADNRALRRQVYEAWISRASDASDNGKYDNGPGIEAILAARRRLANELGYANYAEYALVERMVRSADEAIGFLQDLARRSRERAEREFVELAEFAAQNGLDDALAPWDTGYYSEKLREARYGFDEERLRRYLPLDQVLKGLRNLFHRFYGLSFRTLSDLPLWHPDVMVWELTRRDGAPVGRLYLDLYARPGKRGGAWMDEGGHRLRLDGTERLASAFLTANFMRPPGGQSALLRHDDVVTLCHELGHCLHHLLTRIDYPSVGGISGVEWDAVEFPSQLHEELGWHSAGLKELSADADSDAGMPRDLIDALNASRHFHGAMRLVRQLEFAIFDLELHRLDNATPSITEVRELLAAVRKQVRVTPVSPLDRFECTFAHIFGGGYAAGYYSYLWAELMARDGFSAFTDGEELNPEAGARLARTVLACGSSRPARELYRAFRGRDPQPEALLRKYGIGLSGP
ncbi:MAG TPA: M3 family metallopeptidase [Gammaproteobacteria bacterium]|nr:M3 family metallopeptidase [Gammaproteobacteria bacterium]